MNLSDSEKEYFEYIMELDRNRTQGLYWSSELMYTGTDRQKNRVDCVTHIGDTPSETCFSPICHTIAPEPAGGKPQCDADIIAELPRIVNFVKHLVKKIDGSNNG